jgi:putative membrane protein
MLRRTILTAAMGLGLAAFAGCEQTISGLGGKPSNVIPIGESHFLKVMANSNQQEIEMSQMALKRSHNDKIKEFAQQMIDDHTKANDDLAQLAKSKNAELPKVLGNIEEASVANLASTPDDKFDQAYIDAQIAAHQNAINNAQAEATNGADVDVKAYAQKAVPNLEHHLVMAKALKFATK